jgi:hypothetical protein
MSIEKLKASYEATTQGEWVADDNRTAMAYAGWELVAVDEVPPRVFAVAMPQPEAEFIALARNMMPALLEAWQLLGIAVAVIENEYPETEDPYKIVARYAELKQQLEEEK